MTGAGEEISSPPVAAGLAARGEVRDEVLLGERLRFSDPHGLLHRAGRSHSEAAPTTARGDKGKRPRRRQHRRRRAKAGGGAVRTEQSRAKEGSAAAAAGALQ